MQNIQFHSDLHSFLLQCSTRTACLETKLEEQLVFCSGHPLHHVFLDFTKAYDLFNQAQMLIILQDYGVEPNILWLLSLFWDQHMAIPCQHVFFGKPFPVAGRLATGDIPAIVIFNIMTDTILHHWYLDTTTAGMATSTHIYADNGALFDHNPVHLQGVLTIMEELLLCVGLQINGQNTKSTHGQPHHGHH